MESGQGFRSGNRFEATDFRGSARIGTCSSGSSTLSACSYIIRVHLWRIKICHLWSRDMSDKDVIKDTRPRMDTVIEDFRRKLATVRTGRAAVSLLDTIIVDYYGT